MDLPQLLLFPVLSDIKHWDYFTKDSDEAKQSLVIWISFLELVFLGYNYLLTQYALGRVIVGIHLYFICISVF